MNTFNLLLLLAHTAHAYEITSTPWLPGLRNLVINAKKDMPDNYPDRYEALQDAADLISNTAANVTLEVTEDSDSECEIGNYDSEVWFTQDTDILCDDDGCAIAFMNPTELIGYRVEADVVFDGGFDWVFTDDKDDHPSYTSLSSGDTRPLLNTAVHELLHVTGLSHEDSYYNIMGNAWNVVNTNGDSTDTYVGEDPTQGLIALYGAVDDYEDLALSHWMWSTASEEGYSTHKRVGITDEDGDALDDASISADGDEDVAYEVSEGQTLLVSVTIENNGLSDQEVDLAFFLSTDDNVKPSDQWIETVTAVANANTPYTATYEITLPNGTTGERWIGAKIDYGDEVDEVYNNNNSVYIAALDIQ